jgi:hypothetical protein
MSSKSFSYRGGNPDIKPSGDVTGGVQPIGCPQGTEGFGLAIQSGPDAQVGLGVRLSQGIQPAFDIQRKWGKKGSNSLLWWVVVLGIFVAIAVGVHYHFLAGTKGKVAVSPKEVALRGILYSEGNSSALIGETIVREGDIIDGVKVIKINKKTVEFEKDGEKWIQHCGNSPTLQSYDDGAPTVQP